MRRKVRIIIMLFMTVFCLWGCQSEPEASENGDVLHAKSAAEEEAEKIIGQEEASGDEKDGEEISGSGEPVSMVIGSGENRMELDAILPEAPEEAASLIMQENHSWDKEMLEKFLEPQGEVKDITQEKEKEREEEERRYIESSMKAGMTEEEARAGIVEMAGIGEDGSLVLTDGNRTASLFRHDIIEYEDAAWMEQYYAMHQAGEQKEQKADLSDDKSGISDFPLGEAKRLLMDKLSLLGVREISLEKGYAYESEDFSCYELYFTPSYEGIGAAQAVGQTNGGIWPNGYAFVCRDGVAKLCLDQYYMEIEGEQDSGAVLSWNQVQELLKAYLENGELQCRDMMPFRYIEFVYYPVFDGEELKLVPVWNIHMDFEEYCSYTGGDIWDTCWTIYLNAITGEIEKVQ